MKVVHRSEAKLVLQDSPWLVWAVGGLFVIAGSGVALRSDERVFGVAFAIVGAVLILAFANTVTATFDRDTGRFTRVTSGLVRNSVIAHPLSDIVGVTVEASHSADPNRARRIALELSTGGRLPLTTSYSSGKKDKEEIAEVIRQFIGIQNRRDVALPGFSEMFKLMSDPNAAQRIIALASQKAPREARQQLQAARDLANRHGNLPLAAQIDETLRRM